MADRKSYFNYRTILFFLLVLPLIVGANIALWAAMNRPYHTASWLGETVGLSYSPYRIDQDPLQGITIGPEQLGEDMNLLSTKVQAIRTYSTTKGLDAVPDIAKKYNLSVSVGAWISGDKELNEQEIELLKKIAFKKNVVRVLVGNEAVLRGEVTVPELIEYIRKLKETVWKPVSTAEPWHVWLAHPELGREVDFIGVQLLPYWEGVSVETAVDYVFGRLKALKAAYPDKPIVITEVGWPSRGRIIPRRFFVGMSSEESSQEAVPSLVNQAGFLRIFLNRAKEEKLTYYVMEAFDQPWKIRDEGLAGGYWGIFNALREPKFPLVGELDEYVMWRIWASVAAGLALIPAVVFALGRQQVRPVGQVFFAALAQLAGTGIAWSGLSVTGIYLTNWEVALWSALFFSQGLLLIVLITEAVELVEVLWMRHGERQFKPLRNAAGDHPTAKVSIHVPIHNEPPEMVIETLDALSRLEYPNFEVLVIDNNTKDAATWRPVEQRCAALGPRFRFFHLDPWPGYKGGALNFAMAQTAPDSEIIAVIDSDYQVESDWLSSLLPYFAKPDVAFVQAPQDYRDGGQNRFKTMCYWEYAGFFHIGMVQRNNFNAVIQHGTMTLVRKTALQKVGGWAEWCICEDAELGVKLYREGYDSVYVNVSFGKGLTPDTIGAYMSQRFRWAYGAVQILKRHWRAIFLPLASKRLTRAQSYYFFAGWLPWFADSLALLFTFASMGLSIWALMQPRAAFLPVAAFMIPTIGSFAFKFIRSLWLYAIRVHCSFLYSIGASIAALSLTHTVAKAILAGIFTSGRPFFRTPKCEDKPALAAAFLQVREEALILAILWGLATALFLKPEFYDRVSRLWVAVLLVQSTPYAASVFLSFVNAFVTRRKTATGALMPPAEKADLSASPGGLLIQKCREKAPLPVALERSELSDNKAFFHESSPKDSSTNRSLPRRIVTGLSTCLRGLKAIFFNRYVLLSLFLLAYSSIMEHFGGLPSVLPAWRLELPLLLYIFFYAGSITRKSRFQALAASAPVIIAYIFSDVFYILFGRLLRFAEVTEVPELIHVASPGAIAAFCLAVGLPLLGLLALLDFRRLRAMALGAIPLAALVLCIKLYPDSFLAAFEKTQMEISFYSDSDSVANNGRMSMMLYNEARRRSLRSKVTQWLEDKTYRNKFDKLVEKVGTVKAKRNVHLVVLESFIDPALMNKAKYSRKPAHPDYEAFFKDKVGLSVSPVFCGGTAQAEFEALCGVPALRELSGVEFNLFTGVKTFCAPNVLSRAGYHAIATNSYSPDFFNSVNAYTGIGFSNIYYPREFAPGRDTYFSTGDTTGEKYMFDGNLFSQNLEFIARHIKENPGTPIFNYVIGIYGHIPITMNTDKRPKVVSVKSDSKDDVLEATANQYYYRTEAIAAYVKGLLAIDPNSLIILMSDHLPTLDYGPITYKELQYIDGSLESMYLNRILIVENGKPVKYDTVHHYSVPRIILNYVTNGSYCKEEDCEFTSPKKKPLGKEAFRDEYMAIMAHAMESDTPLPAALSIVKASMDRLGKGEAGATVAH